MPDELEVLEQQVAEIIMFRIQGVRATILEAQQGSGALLKASSVQNGLRDALRQLQHRLEEADKVAVGCLSKAHQVFQGAEEP